MSQLPRERIHEYWRHPWDGVNKPQRYLQGKERSEFLVDLVREYATTSSKILEIGCNVGRNLHYLHEAGFRSLFGIEISEDAVKEMGVSFPELARDARIYVQPAEEALPSLEDRKFDLTFTMAVLEHIHYENDWLFAHIVRVTGRTFISIEDEKNVSERHFPRNYRRVFEALGMRQVERIGGRRIAGLASRYFVARVFERRV